MKSVVKVNSRSCLLRTASRVCFSTKAENVPSETESPEGEPTSSEDNFSVYNFKPDRQFATKERFIKRRVNIKDEELPIRYKQMAVDQDWSSVWPVARSFHPASVPLPIRQGYPKKGQAPPGKFANAELMKIPNFLHLTPPAIEKYCNALKKFCTEWPKELDTDEEIRENFPVEVLSSRYCHSGPSIRDPKARIVTLKVKLSTLPLDEHSRDKLLRLVGPRYDRKTDELILVADRCPTRKQNQEYLDYLLSVLMIESSKREPWESEKTEVDMEKYVWTRNQGKENTVSHLMRIASAKGQEIDETVVVTDPMVREYSQASEELHNKGEDDYTLGKYKESVRKMFSAWGQLPEGKSQSVVQ